MRRLFRPLPVLSFPSLLTLALVLAPAAPALAGRTEEALRDRWHGASVVLATEAFSGCNDSYTNNEVRGRRVVAKTGQRFDAGELGRVYKLNLRRAGVDLLVDLVEPARVSWIDGPFTLYEQRICKAELKFDLPRAMVRADDVESIDRELARSVERHDSLGQAEGSALWNRRRVEPLPLGYERTLAEYEAWKATQINFEVGARIAEWLDRAERIARRVEVDDPAYALGFVEGLEAGGDHSFGDCPSLLSESPPSRRGSGYRGEDPKQWKEGYEDGYRMAYFVAAASRLQGCFVPVPVR